MNWNWNGDSAKRELASARLRATGGAVHFAACSVWPRNHTSARVKMQRLESAIEKATGLDLDNDGTVVELK